MINDLRTGIKLMKYGINTTMNLILAVIMLLFGLVMEAAEIFDSGVFTWIPLGMVMLVCTGGIPAQLVISVDVSSLAQSSACKKKLQTKIPALLMGIGSIAGLTVSAIVRGIRVAAGADERVLKSMVSSGIIAAMLIVYFAFVYKYYIASIVVLYAGMLVSGFFGGGPYGALWSELLEGPLAAVPTVLCVTIAYVIVLAAIGLQYLISLALYKKPISKACFGAALRRSM